MPQKLLFVINPHSGKGEMRHAGIDCIDRFVHAGYEVTVHTTQGVGDAMRYVAAEGDRFDLVVCSGGDGTLNETVAGLMQLTSQPPLGYIPTGTVNDFASSLGIPKHTEEATSLILTGTPYAVDIGQFGARYFTYVAGFGAFTDVSYSTPQNSKNLLGRLAYILEGIKSVPQLKIYNIHATSEDRVIEGEFIYGMVTNATSVGGFKGFLPSDVSMDDGLFEVVLVRAPTNAVELQMILNEVLMPPEEPRFLVRFKTPSICFETEDDMPWTLDGEFGGAPHKVMINNHNKALHIIVRGKKKALPGETASR